MSTQSLDEPKAEMEKALIKEYLNDQGYSLKELKNLPEQVVKQLMKEAIRYASLKMEQIAATAHLIDEIHDKSISH